MGDLELHASDVACLALCALAWSMRFPAKEDADLMEVEEAARRVIAWARQEGFIVD